MDVTKGVPSRDVELHTAKTRLHRAKLHEKEARHQELVEIKEVRNMFFFLLLKFPVITYGSESWYLSD